METALLSPSILMVLTASMTAIFLLRPKVIKARFWRAMLTPLASIIGSGFLVAGPILAHTAGNHAWVAMAFLCGAAYLFGGAIRYNIANVEPVPTGQLPASFKTIERVSDFALAFAYFVSVAYYLNLFASFALRADEIVDPNLTRWFASAIIFTLGVIGAFRGLHTLEHLEAVSVGIKLALIAGLIAALALVMGNALATDSFALAEINHGNGKDEIGILLGLIILVQGFETSRYLGDAYDRPTRIKSMKYAQLLATGIYLLFILLLTPFFTGNLPAVGGETAIITMLVPLGAVVGPLIIFAALASQISAVIVDMNGAGGLLTVASNHRLPMRAGYLLTAAVALVITWTSGILDIIVYASKAFVVYYGLQSGLAALACWRSEKRYHLGHSALYTMGVALSLLVLIFGISAEL